MSTITCLVYDGINRTYETVVGLCTYACQNGVLAKAGTMPTDTADRHMALLGLLTCNSDKCNEQKCADGATTANQNSLDLPQATGLSSNQITGIIVACFIFLIIIACMIYGCCLACINPQPHGSYL